MAPIVSSSKALARLMSGKNRALDFGRGLGLLGNCGENKRQFGRLSQTRISSSIARVGNSSVGGLVGTFRDPASSIGYLQRNAQTRRFLGCGDGEERGVLSKVYEERQVTFRDPASSIGYLQRNAQTRRFLGCGDGEERGVLSKVYEERQVMGYSPEQLFSVVASVDLYEDFVPWCQRSKVIRRYDDGSFDAELEIGFKFLVESYISHVELRKPRYIKTTASESMLFDHLINIWEFNPGPVPGTCELYFLVDFKFQSPLYRQVASMFFKEVVSRLVSSFSERCHRIYGPAVTVLENTYGQSR